MAELADAHGSGPCGRPWGFESLYPHQKVADFSGTFFLCRQLITCSLVDVVGILTDSKDPTAYWRKLKQRLKSEGNETVTNCHGLKMTAPDGKKRLTDVATTEQLFRIIQSIPSRKAVSFDF